MSKDFCSYSMTGTLTVTCLIEQCCFYYGKTSTQTANNKDTVQYIRDLGGQAAALVVHIGHIFGACA